MVRPALVPSPLHSKARGQAPLKRAETPIPVNVVRYTVFPGKTSKTAVLDWELSQLRGSYARHLQVGGGAPRMLPTPYRAQDGPVTQTRPPQVPECRV